MSTYARIQALAADGIVHECSSTAPAEPIDIGDDIIMGAHWRFLFHSVEAMDGWRDAVSGGKAEAAAYDAYLRSLPE